MREKTILMSENNDKSMLYICIIDNVAIIFWRKFSNL